MSRSLLVVLLLTGCQPLEVKVGKARLAEADSARPAPEGPTVEVPGGTVPATVSGPVLIAADRDATYAQVLDAMSAVRKAGGEPVLLVAHKRKPAALPPPVAHEEPSIRLAIDTDMRACVGLPGWNERKCVERADGKHIDRAFVRELVREGVKASALTRVHVELPGAIAWAEVVRAVDGARTCCGATEILVSVDY